MLVPSRFLATKAFQVVMPAHNLTAGVFVGNTEVSIFLDGLNPVPVGREKTLHPSAKSCQGTSDRYANTLTTQLPCLIYCAK